MSEHFPVEEHKPLNVKKKTTQKNPPSPQLECHKIIHFIYGTYIELHIPCIGYISIHVWSSNPPLIPLRVSHVGVKAVRQHSVWCSERTVTLILR